MDLSKIRTATSVTDLREAVADAFAELSQEKTILARLDALEAAE